MALWKTTVVLALCLLVFAVLVSAGDKQDSASASASASGSESGSEPGGVPIPVPIPGVPSHGGPSKSKSSASSVEVSVLLYLASVVGAGMLSLRST